LNNSLFSKGLWSGAEKFMELVEWSYFLGLKFSQTGPKKDKNKWLISDGNKRRTHGGYGHS